MEGGHLKVDLTRLIEEDDYAPRDYWNRLREITGESQAGDIGRIVIAVSSRPGVEQVVYQGRPFDGETRSDTCRECAHLTDWNTAQMKAARPERLVGMGQREAFKEARRAYLATGALNNSRGLPEYFLRLIPAMIGRQAMSNTAREKIVNQLAAVVAERRLSLFDVLPASQGPVNRDRRELTYLDQLGGLIQEAGMGFMDQALPEWRDRQIGRTLLEIAYGLNNPLCSYELRANGLVTREVRRRDFDIKFFQLYMDAKEGPTRDKPDEQRRAFAQLQKSYSECFLRWGTERKKAWGVYDIGIGLEWMKNLGYRHNIYSQGNFGREYVMFGTPRVERPHDHLTGKGAALKQASDLVVRIDGRPYYIQSKVSGGSNSYAKPIIVTHLSSGPAQSPPAEASSNDVGIDVINKQNAARRFPEIAEQYQRFYQHELEILDPNSPEIENPIIPRSIEELLATEILSAT